MRSLTAFLFLLLTCTIATAQTYSVGVIVPSDDDMRSEKEVTYWDWENWQPNSWCLPVLWQLEIYVNGVLEETHTGQHLRATGVHGCEFTVNVNPSSPNFTAKFTSPSHFAWKTWEAFPSQGMQVSCDAPLFTIPMSHGGTIDASNAAFWDVQVAY